jgi:hypothetical protein
VYYCNGCKASFIRPRDCEPHQLIVCPDPECETVRPACTPCKDHGCDRDNINRLYHHTVHDKLLLYTPLPEELIHLVREGLQGYSVENLNPRKRKRKDEEEEEE